jgi:lysozyme
MSAIDLTVARLGAEEGFRADAYDDATGKPVNAQGQITIGYGCRCRQWSSELATAVLRFQLGEVEAQLLQFAWYAGCDPVRQSVLVDLAYNLGLTGLLGFVHFLADIARRDWMSAAANLMDSKAAAGAPDRYKALAAIIQTGRAV